MVKRQTARPNDPQMFTVIVYITVCIYTYRKPLTPAMKACQLSALHLLDPSKSNLITPALNTVVLKRCCANPHILIPASAKDQHPARLAPPVAAVE